MHSFACATASHLSAYPVLLAADIRVIQINSAVQPLPEMENANTGRQVYPSSLASVQI